MKQIQVKKSMKIVIVGTRGIPDLYRGFEKGAQYIALGLAERGHEVTVYNSHNHSYQGADWCGIKLIHVYDPEYKLGALGNFIYDYNCFKDLKNRKCDLVIQFGASSSFWSWLMPKNTLLISNISSTEWKRSRHGIIRSRFLRLAEKFAVRYSDSLVSDSTIVNYYLNKRYQKRAKYIAQGVDVVFTNANDELLKIEDVKPFEYNLYIGSLEKDGVAELILDGVVASGIEKIFLVIGNYSSKFGSYLSEKYQPYAHIKFLGSVYEADRLDNLRYFSNLYFYGSGHDGSVHLLLEAMASNCLITAYDNDANRSILTSDSFYFQDSEAVAKQLIAVEAKMVHHVQRIDRNKAKIREIYNWSNVVDQYVAHFDELIAGRNF